MKKTVVSHFYNEEHLLPWWLRQHKQIFDHGIMIDYASNDRSVEIIKEICPTWEIRPSRNEYFDPGPIDQEVMDIERELTGWRIALNVTEFLYGNLDLLDDDPKEKILEDLRQSLEDAKAGRVHDIAELWDGIDV